MSPVKYRLRDKRRCQPFNPPPSGLAGTVQGLAQRFTSVMIVILATLDNTVIYLARLAYISVLMVGLLLYYTHTERRLGKDLIKGGIVLAILAEFVFPALVKL